MPFANLPCVCTAYSFHLLHISWWMLSNILILLLKHLQSIIRSYNVSQMIIVEFIRWYHSKFSHSNTLCISNLCPSQKLEMHINEKLLLFHHAPTYISCYNKMFPWNKTHEMNKIDDMCCYVIAIFGITARILILSCLMWGWRIT